MNQPEPRYWAPALFRRQIADGAWAITAATVRQARTMYTAGVRRVLIANEVVVPAEVAWLAEAMTAGFDVYCYVDSVVGAEIMGETLAEVRANRPLPVLLEMGIAGGRTGVRTVAEGLAVAESVAASPHLALTGTAGFEGIIPSSDPSAIETVDEFLDSTVELTQGVAARGWFEPTPEVIVTAGGSAYFDRVAERFSRVTIDEPMRVVIRSGCYLTHDDGLYVRASPMAATSDAGEGTLQPAVEVWGAVLSRPEPFLALVGIGKRDASPDGLLPLAKKIRRRGSSVVESIEPNRVRALDDQHAYLDLDPSDTIGVGDLVGFGISNPCTTFDKWRAMALVDDDYTVLEVVETLF